MRAQTHEVPISGCCFLDFIVQRFFESVNNRESRLQRSTADAFDRPRAIHKVLFQGVVDVFEANCVRIFFTCTYDASTHAHVENRGRFACCAVHASAIYQLCRCIAWLLSQPPDLI